MNLPKRLIEVDLPIARISAHARREKSIRHGHISTLHIWWARRPLAACRAVILASLWPDPVDLARWAKQGHDIPIGDGTVIVRPMRFLDEAKARMLRWAQIGYGKSSEESGKRLMAIQHGSKMLDDPKELRSVLLDFIADFANWDNSTDPAFLETARALTQAAHEALGGEPHSRPLVIDPFAGGGSIPLEALRVGADAFASDLNPIPILLNKVVLEYIPKYGQRLADEVRRWGQWIKEQAEKELAEFYPKDPARPPKKGDKDDEGEPEATPIAYLWARTVLSEAPGEGDIPVEVPLMRSLWLAKKAGRKRALRWVRDERGKVKTQTVEVAYVEDGQRVVRRVKRPLLEIFEPTKDSEVEGGTVARGNATCPVTGFTTKVVSVRAQLKKRRGGSADARLFCVVTTRNTEQGRLYRLPKKGDQEASDAAAAELATRLKNEGGARTQRSQVLTRAGGGTVQSGLSTSGTLSIVPDEPTPLGGGPGAGRAFSQRNYGMDFFADLFAPRQLLALTTLARLVRDVGERIQAGKDGGSASESGPIDEGLAEAVVAVLAIALSRVTDISNAMCRWKPSMDQAIAMFGRQAIGMMWDFAETSPVGKGAAGDFAVTVGNMLRVLHEIAAQGNAHGHVEQASATNHPLPDDAAAALVTDPPYYDAVPYSDLSDFFYVWLKRTLPLSLAPAFTETLTPKDAECIVDDAKGKDKQFFETSMQKAMAEGRRIVRPDGIGVVVFAHKSTAGWEAQLKAMIDAGWIITGSWPIDTEMGTRLRAQGSAALASSVHMVMRPRENPDGSVATGDVGEWRNVLEELPRRIREWMPRLAEEGVVGADAIFACLGPALEVYSRYARVERASGEAVLLPEYLEHVWGTVSTEALTLIFKDADAGGLEPDARLTAMWLWTLGAGDATKRPSDEATEGEEEADEEEGVAGGGAKTTRGFALEFDAARKIAQGLGVHLDKCQSFVEVKGETARLLSVGERVRYLFGKDAESAPASEPKGRRKKAEPTLFQSLEEVRAEIVAAEAEAAGKLAAAKPGATALDRVHQAMLLFSSERGEALRRFVVDDGIGRDSRFWKLADSLSKLYPAGSEEKRWVDGVLARKKSYGF